MKKNIARFYTFFIAIILLIIIMTISTISIVKNNPSPAPTPKKTIPAPYTSVTPEFIKPPSLKEVPINIPQRGGGIDLNSPIVQDSIAEIQKLYPYLPYSEDITFPNGMTVSVYIPVKELQTAPWTLTAQIFNIDYNTPVTDPKFLSMKSTFRKSVVIIFDWIRSHGADPEKILYTWGHKAFIQNQAERWLYNN